MADFASQISQARQAGYSDQEITAYLGKDPTLQGKIGQAKAAGYQDSEIVDHLASAPAKPPGVLQQAGSALSGAWDKLKSDTATIAKQSADTSLPSGPIDALRREAVAQGRNLGVVKDVAGLAAAPAAAVWNGLVAHPFGEAVASLPIQNYSAPTLSFKNGIHAVPGRPLTREETAQSYQNALNTGLGAMLPGPGAAVAGAARVAPNPLAMGGQDALAAKALARARPDLNAMRATAQQMQDAGVAPSLVDVAGDAGRRLVRAVGVKNADAGEVLASNAQAVSSTAKPAIMARTRGVVGDARTAEQLAADVQQARDSGAKTNYAEPYAKMIDVPDSVKEMLNDSAGRSIIGRARADAIENQDWGAQVELDKLLRPTVDGNLPQISGGTLDRLAIAARERGAAFAASGRNYRARGAYGRQEQINQTLDAAPGLEDARADYRAKSQALDVLGKGRKDVFSTDPADYASWLQDLSPEARKANQVAIRQEVLDTLGGQRSSTFGSVDELATSEYAKANLRQALGKAADPYLGYLNAKLSQVRNARMVDPNAGSRTAVLSNDLAGVLHGAAHAADVGVKMAKGDVVGLIGKAANWLKTRGVSDAEAQALAKASVDPAALPRVLKQLENRMGRPAAMRYLHVVKSVPVLPAVGAAQSIQGPSGTAPALVAPASASQQQ